MRSARIIGLFVGLVLGIVWMWLGFGAALLSAFLGLLGWFIGAVVASAAAGHLNLEDLRDDILGRGGATS
jgi:hypothetical protein